LKASFTVARAAAPAAHRSAPASEPGPLPPPERWALPDSERLGDLVRLALRVVESRTSYAVAGPQGDLPRQVLFDIDVDGERYVLIRAVPIGGGARLSPRERQVVQMVALGYSNKVIAAHLRISAWTVCTHVRRIFAKLGVSSRAAMVAKVAEAARRIELGVLAGAQSEAP
jgi:DNA-binding CsgD family transcriptional regulator